MATKVKNKEGFQDSSRPSAFGRRGYYFHADEDFREDREWGKIQTKGRNQGKSGSGLLVSAT